MGKEEIERLIETWLEKEWEAEKCTQIIRWLFTSRYYEKSWYLGMIFEIITWCIEYVERMCQLFSLQGVVYM